MAEVFTNYPDISEAASESTDKTDSQPTMDAKTVKRLNKVLKQLRKQNKLLKQIRRHHVVVEPPKDEQSAVSKEESPKSTGRQEKSFLSKLGDVFLKALPGILATAVSGIVTAIFGRGFKRARIPMGATI